MEQVEFIKKLYNGKNCYSDFMNKEQLDILRIASHVDELIEKYLPYKMIFLTGNPGDGKTYIIKSHDETIKKYNVYENLDINSLDDDAMNIFANKLVELYNTGKPCIIAANEYPFLLLQKKLKNICIELYRELNECKKHNIIYGNNHYSCGKCIVIDLNERNLLYTSDASMVSIENIIDRTIDYLESGNLSGNQYSLIRENINHLKKKEIQSKIVNLLNYVAFTGTHFVVRDILGFISYLFLSSLINEDSNLYYDALYEVSANNKIIKELQKFDPIKMSNPAIDEKLWNGEITQNWVIDKPEVIPAKIEDIDETLSAFKSIKRKYYFENSQASAKDFIDKNYQKILQMIKHPYKRENIENIILAMNGLYLPNEKEDENLLIWTTNRYDTSIDYKAAVCTKTIYKDKFELLVPEKDVWQIGRAHV